MKRCSTFLALPSATIRSMASRQIMVRGEWPGCQQRVDTPQLLCGWVGGWGVHLRGGDLWVALRHFRLAQREWHGPSGQEPTARGRLSQALKRCSASLTRT
jgi:hypothetical protein